MKIILSSLISSKLTALLLMSACSSSLFAAPVVIKKLPETNRVAQIASMLPAIPKGIGEPCSNRMAWADARKFPGMSSTLRHADMLTMQEMPAWSDAEYLKYSKSGNRTDGEKMISARRAYLFPLAMAACLTANPKTVARLEEVMLDLLSDPSWTLPAHDSKLANFKDKRYDVDLIAADFAFDIAHIIYMLQGQLSQKTVEKSMNALEERIFKPMRSTFASGKGHWWLYGENNWLAVCLDGITGAALTVIQDKNDRALFAAVAESYIPNYFNSFSDDGYAYEGASYWSYGFSHFVSLRNTLVNSTAGGIDLFEQHSKTREMALYPNRISMYEGNFALFGDARPNSSFNRYALKVAHEAFQLKQPIVPINLAMSSYVIPRAAALMTWTIPSVVASSEVSNNSLLRHYFPSVGVLVSRSIPNTEQSLNITIKSGGNQNHSHDDNGSYALGVGGAQPIGDPGVGVYSAKTFSKQRYDIKAINSYGHPVPVIDNQLQRRAGTYTSSTPKLTVSDAIDTYVLDMKPAYSINSITKLERTMTHSRAANIVNVQDDFLFSKSLPFETAVISLGEGQKIDEKSYYFSHLGKIIKATFSASSSFKLIPEIITEEGMTFHRIAIRFDNLELQGYIKVEYAAQ